MTRVARVVTLTIPPSLRLVQPVLVRAFRAESARTLMALKAYADAPASLPARRALAAAAVRVRRVQRLAHQRARNPEATGYFRDARLELHERGNHVARLWHGVVPQWLRRFLRLVRRSN